MQPKYCRQNTDGSFCAPRQSYVVLSGGQISKDGIKLDYGGENIGEDISVKVYQPDYDQTQDKILMLNQSRNHGQQWPGNRDDCILKQEYVNGYPVLSVDSIGASCEILSQYEIDLNNKSFTIEFSYNGPLNDIDSNIPIILQGDSSTGQACSELRIQFEVGQNIRFGFYNNDIVIPGIAETGWHHWAFVYDHVAESMKVYKDGVDYPADGNMKAPLNVVESKIFRIEGVAPIGKVAQIAGIRIWKTVRTQEQIQVYMDSEYSSEHLHLIACWNGEYDERSYLLTDKYGLTPVQYFRSITSQEQTYVKEHSFDTSLPIILDDYNVIPYTVPESSNSASRAICLVNISEREPQTVTFMSHESDTHLQIPRLAIDCDYQILEPERKVRIKWNLNCQGSPQLRRVNPHEHIKLERCELEVISLGNQIATSTIVGAQSWEHPRQLQKPIHLDLPQQGEFDISLPQTTSFVISSEISFQCQCHWSQIPHSDSPSQTGHHLRWTIPLTILGGVDSLVLARHAEEQDPTLSYQRFLLFSAEINDDTSLFTTNLYSTGIQKVVVNPYYDLHQLFTLDHQQYPEDGIVHYLNAINAAIEESDEEFDSLSQPFPKLQIDFWGAYGIYAWEIFHYIPLMLADKYTQGQQFDLARKWLQHVYDPTLKPDVWGSLPLAEYEPTNSALMTINDHDAAIARENPYYYRLAAVRQYAQNWIEQGDYYYNQATAETLRQAKLCYVEVKNLFHETPESPASLEGDTEAGDWNDPTLGEVVEEDFYPPYNEEVQKIYDTLEQRLYNLRLWLSIDGSPLNIPLIAPPIDPRLLQ